MSRNMACTHIPKSRCTLCYQGMRSKLNCLDPQPEQVLQPTVPDIERLLLLFGLFLLLSVHAIQVHRSILPHEILCCKNPADGHQTLQSRKGARATRRPAARQEVALDALRAKEAETPARRQEAASATLYTPKIVGYILGYIGIMENKMETTIIGFIQGYMLGLYIRIMQNNTETATMGYIGLFCSPSDF